MSLTCAVGNCMQHGCLQNEKVNDKETPTLFVDLKTYRYYEKIGNYVFDFLRVPAKAQPGLSN